MMFFFPVSSVYVDSLLFGTFMFFFVVGSMNKDMIAGEMQVRDVLCFSVNTNGSKSAN